MEGSAGLRCVAAWMCCTVRTPLRVKACGAFIETIELPAIVQAVCWRLNALATFQGGGPWAVDHRAIVA